MTTATYDEFLDRRFVARERRDEIAFEKLMKREDKARQMIGHLIRDGQQVFYVNLPNNRTKEAASERALVDFLIRNHYA